MSGSVIGNRLHVSTFGESHGKAIGAVLDGFPAGMELSEEDIQPYLDRRRPGKTAIATPRKEADTVEIVSGVFEGRTTGTPIAMLIRNTSQRPADYDAIKEIFRPGHADYGYQAKYGIRDFRGGGRSSGRETAGRVMAGAVCMKLLKEMGIDVCAYTLSIGSVRIDPARFDKEAITQTATAMPDVEADRKALDLLKTAMEQSDSVGGVVECVISNVPAGIGEPVFDKLDARFAAALMSIGAVKAVEVGDGVRVTTKAGSENNDAFTYENGSFTKTTNHAGGILGGISDGSPVILRAHIKPTASIAREQKSADQSGQMRTFQIKGRHDPVIVPRAVVVVEAMCAFTLLDLMLVNMGARADHVISFYRS